MATNNSRPNLAKRNSLAQITLEVERKGPLSRMQLANSTGFSLTHICRIVDDLMQDGELIETTLVTGHRGRPSSLLDINPDSGTIAGFRLGPEEADIAVANTRGTILARRNVVFSSDTEPCENTVQAIAQGIRRCALAANKNPKHLKGLGVSVAGLADPLIGVVDGLTNRRGWESVPIGAMLEKELRIPVFVDNDVRAGALAAQWSASEENESGVLFLHVGEGVGAAYVQGNHELLRGAHDAAGLLGHMTVERNGHLCGCGNRGCLETVASDAAFITGIWSDLPVSIRDMSAVERINYVRTGLALAKQGDPVATAALNQVTDYLGIGVANAIAMFDPQTVRIFGTLIDIEPVLVTDMIRRSAFQHVWPRTRGVQIQHPVHRQEFLIQGALGLVKWQPYRKLQEELNSANGAGVST